MNKILGKSKVIIIIYIYKYENIGNRRKFKYDILSLIKTISFRNINYYKNWLIYTQKCFILIKNVLK